MRAVQLRSTEGIAGMVMTELPRPEPAAGEILLRVRAVSINYREYKIALGEYGRFDLPLVPCSDAVGEVVALGDGVSRWKVGDRVSPHYVVDWLDGPPRAESLARRLGGPLPGMLAEYVCVGEQAAVRPPAHLDDIHAATLPIAGVTAWHSLFVADRVRPGDTVLVQGTGGVSVFALQLGVMAGARVIATSSSDQKLARCRELGAAEVVNYRDTLDWPAAVQALTGGRGADHVLDVVGGDNLSRSIAAARVGATVRVIGFLDDLQARVDLPLALSRVVTLACVSVGSRASFEALVRALETARVTPVVDRVFGFQDFRAAFEHLAAGRHFGKIVIAMQ